QVLYEKQGTCAIAANTWSRWANIFRTLRRYDGSACSLFERSESIAETGCFTSAPSSFGEAPFTTEDCTAGSVTIKETVAVMDGLSPALMVMVCTPGELKVALTAFWP